MFCFVSRGLDRVGEELETNLGSIQVVTGAVKILSSEAVVSLNFLRNLSVIQGQSLLNERYCALGLGSPSQVPHFLGEWSSVEPLSDSGPESAH